MWGVESSSLSLLSQLDNRCPFVGADGGPPLLTAHSFLFLLLLLPCRFTQLSACLVQALQRLLHPSQVALCQHHPHHKAAAPYVVSARGSDTPRPCPSLPDSLTYLHGAHVWGHVRGLSVVLACQVEGPAPLLHHSLHHTHPKDT